MDVNVSGYEYVPMFADREVRILRLEAAAQHDEPLIASLITRLLQDDPESPSLRYDCVSYCWGTSGKSKSLLCYGHVLDITENVDMMLRHLRKPTRPRNLWVDAICIDQSNDEEKSQQVQLMGAIYERASKVHIWMGPALVEDNIPSVFALLQRYALNTNIAPYSNEVDKPSLSGRTVASLASFLTREWFNRRWVRLH
jgi:hypothetical protein